MKVKVREVKRKKGFFTVVQSGLGVAIVASENDSPVHLVEGIVRPILKWRKKREGKTFALSLTFSAIPDMHLAIEAALFQLYRRNADLQYAMDRTQSISVTLCTESGSPLRSYSLDHVALLQGKYVRQETPIELFNAPSERRARERREKGKGQEKAVAAKDDPKAKPDAKGRPDAKPSADPRSKPPAKSPTAAPPDKKVARQR